MSDIENKTEDVQGRIKEAAGSLTNDQDLKDEGRADQASASIKDKLHDAVEKVEDGIDKVKDAITKD